MLFNLIDPRLNDIIEDHQREASVEFDSTADWTEAFNKTLANQRLVETFQETSF